MDTLNAEQHNSGHSKPTDRGTVITFADEEDKDANEAELFNWKRRTSAPDDTGVFTNSRKTGLTLRE